MEQIVIWFVNDTDFIKFKAKDSNIVTRPLCLENISKDWSTDNMKKVALLVIFMILVLVIMLLVSMILKTFVNI